MKILSAGDRFILPTLFTTAIRERVPSHELDITELELPWPHVPFGRVDGVDEASGTAASMIEAIGDAEIAVTQLAPFTREVFEACPGLKFVGVSRGGPVNVDLDAASDAGVQVAFAPGRNAQAAAEYTIGLMLAAMRRIPIADSELKKGEWRGDYYAWENAGSELGGETVGLIGYGAIGSIVGRILRAFGAEVITHDPYADSARLAADGVRSVSLDEIIERSGVISLHARLTDETRHIMNAERLGAMRRGAVVVNAARGGLLDYDALPALLDEGRIGAVALDVYDIEPPAPGSPLIAHPNVVASPHLAGATRQTAERAATIIADEVARYIAGDALEHPANPTLAQS